MAILMSASPLKAGSNDVESRRVLFVSIYWTGITECGPDAEPDSPELGSRVRAVANGVRRYLGQLLEIIRQVAATFT